MKHPKHKEGRLIYTKQLSSTMLASSAKQATPGPLNNLLYTRPSRPHLLASASWRTLAMVSSKLPVETRPEGEIILDGAPRQPKGKIE
jgi:hypothetical protein